MFTKQLITANIKLRYHKIVNLLTLKILKRKKNHEI